MTRSSVIGDVHGHYNTLLEMISQLEDKGVEEIYSVGDLIDRGPFSKNVVQLCIDKKVKCVKGNHSDLFLSYIMEDNRYEAGLFEINGGIETLKSYMNKDKEVDIPDSHFEFIMNMPYYIETDDFILTHGGVPITMENTFRDMSQRSKDAVMWNRGLISRDLEKLQIFGHTPNYPIKVYRDSDYKPYAFNVDSGCFRTGILSAIIINGDDHELVQVKRSAKDETPAHIEVKSIYN